MKSRSFREWIFPVLLLLGVTGLLAQAKVPLFGRKNKRDPKVQPAVATTPAQWSQVAAEVNGEPITFGELAEELITTHGKKHLELMINRKLVELACQEREIEITPGEVDREIKKKLKKLNLSRREFIERVLARKGMTYRQYIRDTIWPSVALTRLVEDRVEITDEDLRKAFEATYGEMVECRMLVVLELRKAQQLWKTVQDAKDPQTGEDLDAKGRLNLFEDLVKKYSIDAATRSLGGKALFNRHSSFSKLEEIVFALEEGELSRIVEHPDGNLILLCVRRVSPRENVVLDSPFREGSEETVKDVLYKDIHQKKVRQQVALYFQELRKSARIDNFLTGDFDIDGIKPAGHSEKAAPPPPKKSAPSK